MSEGLKRLSTFRGPHAAPRSLSFARGPAVCVCACALLFVCTSLARASGAWSRQNSGTFAWLHAVYFLDGHKGWAVGGNGVMLSTEDGGASWKAMHRPTEDALNDVYFSDAQTG
ncbi:MAG TPA: hypothetical protein VF507_02095, partial [Pyrinomonadaceae bacterium]